jgi:hypothetical protein
MLFDSFPFLIFFAAFLLAYRLAPRISGGGGGLDSIRRVCDACTRATHGEIPRRRATPW